MWHARRSQFADRREAGRLLAERVRTRRLENPVVYALPRGGVPVAEEIAAALGAPLDLVLVRKLGAPGQPELGIGAVVDGAEPETVLNEDIVALTGASASFIAASRARELEEIERRRQRYLAGRAPLDPKGRAAVVVDDGIATGATAKAALRALRRRGAARLLLAVPVAPPDTVKEMRGEADEVICLVESEIHFGIGAFYDDFHQLSDAEVIALLDAHRPAR